MPVVIINLLVKLTLDVVFKGNSVHDGFVIQKLFQCLLPGKSLKSIFNPSHIEKKRLHSLVI